MVEMEEWLLNNHYHHLLIDLISFIADCIIEVIALFPWRVVWACFITLCSKGVGNKPSLDHPDI